MTFNCGSTYLIHSFEKNNFKAILNGNSMTMIIVNIVLLILDIAISSLFFNLFKDLRDNPAKVIFLGIVLIGFILLVSLTIYTIFLLLTKKVFYYSTEEIFFDYYIFNWLISRKKIHQDDLDSIAIGCTFDVSLNKEEAYFSVSILFNRDDLPNICLTHLNNNEVDVYKLAQKLFAILKIKIHFLVLTQDDIIIQQLDASTLFSSESEFKSFRELRT